MVKIGGETKSDRKWYRYIPIRRTAVTVCVLLSVYIQNWHRGAQDDIMSFMTTTPNGASGSSGSNTLTAAVGSVQDKNAQVPQTNQTKLPSFQGKNSAFLDHLVQSEQSPSNQNVRQDVGRLTTADTNAKSAAKLVDAGNSDTTSSTKTSTTTTTTTTTTDPSNKPLNVIILYPDDWRHDSIGGVGPVVQTPFLNQLAREGIRFSHNCVTTSICWISRASFFTGQYAARHQSYKLYKPWPIPFYNTTFIDHRIAWPAMLQDAGYYTGHVGKWQYRNEDRTVESFFNYTYLFEGGHWYPNDTIVDRLDPKTNKTRKYRIKGSIHGADLATQKVHEFLNTRPKDHPFAITVAFYPPKAVGTSSEPGGQWTPKNETEHLFDNVTVPMPPDTYHNLPWFFRKHERIGRGRWKQRFEGESKFQVSMKRYYRLIYEVDQACEQIVKRLKQDGLYENTLIIFTTDNGFFMGEHGLTGKWYPHEESIRVPLIIRDPRMPLHKRNTVNDALTLNIDLAETILGAAGISPPSAMQGRDISDLYLTSKNNDDYEEETVDWRSEFYYEWPVRNGRTFPMATALVRHDFKYMKWPEYNYEQLFHLISDPHEEHDLFDDPKYNATLLEMRRRHDQLAELVK